MGATATIVKKSKIFPPIHRLVIPVLGLNIEIVGAPFFRVWPRSGAKTTYPAARSAYPSADSFYSIFLYDNPTSSGGETNRIWGKNSPDSYTTCWGKSSFYLATRLVQIELVNALSNLLACPPQEHSNQWYREFSTIGLTRKSEFRITGKRDGMSRCQVLCLSAKNSAISRFLPHPQPSISSHSVLLFRSGDKDWDLRMDGMIDTEKRMCSGCSFNDMTYM